MLSLKIIPYKEDKNGKAILYLRITQNRKPYYHQVLINEQKIVIDKKHWNASTGKIKKGHPYHDTLNYRLNELLIKAEKNIITNERVTPADIFNCLFNENAESLIAFYGEKGKEKKSPFTRADYDKKIAEIKRFTKGKDLPFSAITVDWLKKYHQYLSLKLEQTSIHSHLKTLKAVYNAKIPPRLDRNVFNYFKWEKGEHHQRDALSAKEVQQIIQANDLLNEYEKSARNIFVFSLYCHGMRISDLLQLKWENVDLCTERINYTMQKSGTRKNIKISSALRVLLKDIEKPGKYLFPYLPEGYESQTPERKRKLLQAKTSLVNKYLKSIGAKIGVHKNISTHIARNTVANLLRLKGENTALISDILGHHDENTTKHYLQQWENDKQDEAMQDLF